MKSSHIIGAAIAAMFAIAAVPAMAHPKLVSSSPAAQATVSDAKQVSLTFSETLMAPVSGADLAMTGMPGMALEPMVPEMSPVSGSILRPGGKFSAL